MTRNVVFGGFWKRLEVLGTRLELPSELGESWGAEPPKFIAVRTDMSFSYAVCSMLHAVCGLLYAELCAVCCVRRKRGGRERRTRRGRQVAHVEAVRGAHVEGPPRLSV